MKVVITLNGREFKRLMELTFLGNYVINGIRKEEDQVKEYNRLDRKLTRLEYEMYKKIPGKNAEENELAKDVFRDKMAKWIAWVNYPIIPGDEESLEKHLAAEREYRELVKEQGIRFMQISAPKIDDKLNIEK